MSDSLGDGVPSKRLKLADLIPPKLRVETSNFELYVRHLVVSDWGKLTHEDSEELGTMAIKLLTNLFEDKEDRTLLPTLTFSELNRLDIEKIVKAIAKKNSLDAAEGAGPKELGELLKAKRTSLNELYKAKNDAMRDSLSLKYAFLDRGVLGKLQEQVSGLSMLRSLIEDNKRSHQFAAPSIQASITKPVNYESSIIERTPIHIPRQEETPIGRATLESAKNSKETVEKIDALAEIIGGLNQTLITDVLPSWFEQVQQNQNSSKQALNQAADGLWWTKWAVIASVVVAIISIAITVAMTIWQIRVAKEIDVENTKQQLKLEVLLNKYLILQEKQVEQGLLDKAEVKEILSQQKTGNSKTQKKH